MSFDLQLVLAEATLDGLALDLASRRVQLSVRVAVLDEDAAEPTERTVSIRLHPVGRIAAYLRRGPLMDDPSEVPELLDEATYVAMPVELSRLAEVVEPFLGGDGGWVPFVVNDDPSRPAEWGGRVSVDQELGAGDGRSRALQVLWRGIGARLKRDLDLVVWFDDVAVFREGKAVDPDELQLGVERQRSGMSRGLVGSLESYLPILRRLGDPEPDVEALLDGYMDLWLGRDSDVRWVVEVFEHHQRLWGLWEFYDDKPDFPERVIDAAAQALDAFERFIAKHGANGQ